MASSDDAWRAAQDNTGLPNDPFGGEHTLGSDSVALHETYASLVGEHIFTEEQALWLLGAMVTGNPGPPPGDKRIKE